MSIFTETEVSALIEALAYGHQGSEIHEDRLLGADEGANPGESPPILL